MSDEPLTGGCQCGAVRFAAYDLRGAGVCHCRMCQKAFGSVFAPLVTAGRVEWTRGEPARFRSSSMAVRGFCRDCGTPLTYEPDGSKTDLAIGAFDEPARIRPTTQHGIEARIAWVGDIATLPGRETTEQNVRSFQHPDDDS
ncbi:MAG TPA: GFA family protein [Caulobacteraceae bacterium]|jgi:hypothetical protein